MPTGRRVSKRAACGSVFGNPDDASGPGRAQGCLRAVSDTGFEVEHGLATSRKLAIDLLESVVTACSEHQGVAPLSAPNPVASLMPLGRPFDGFVEHAKRVSPTCLISFERNRYSVPASFANRPVSVRIYPERIVIAAEGQILCEHGRVIQRSHDLPGRTIYDWRHYLAVVQRKPGALRNGAPFAELPDTFRTLQQHLLKKPGGDREMVDILALVLQHDEQAVLSAVDTALKSGVPTKTHILNVLHRLVDGKSFTPPTISAPQALALTNEPKANVERYDALRKTEVRHAS